MTNIYHQPHPSFNQPKDVNIKVWKYMDLAKFVWLLKNKKLFLSSVSNLNDPHEGSTPTLNYERMSEVFNSLTNVSSLSPNEINHGLSVTYKAIRDATFVSCWTMNNDESEAMWKLYCPGDQGIAIQSTYRILASQIKDENMFIGVISYIDYTNQVIDEGNLFNRFMHKRSAFKHESEVRIVKLISKFIPQFKNGVNINSEVIPKGIELEIDLIELIENIYINPYADNWFYESTKIIIEYICPALISKINWSYMKSEPFF